MFCRERFCWKFPNITVPSGYRIDSQFLSWLSDTFRQLTGELTVPNAPDLAAYGLAQDFSISAHTGTTSPTVIYSLAGAIEERAYYMAGRRLRTNIYGALTGTLAGNVTLVVKLATVAVATVVLPATLTAQPFQITVDTLCTGPTNQVSFTELKLGTAQVLLRTLTTIDFSVAGDFAVECTLANAADSISFDGIELLG